MCVVINQANIQINIAVNMKSAHEARQNKKIKSMKFGPDLPVAAAVHVDRRPPVAAGGGACYR